jgi:hypothetical protein
VRDGPRWLRLLRRKGKSNPLDTIPLEPLGVNLAALTRTTQVPAEVDSPLDRTQEVAGPSPASSGPRQLHGLLLGRNPDNPPGEPAALERPDDPAAWVDLETAQTVERGGGKGVMVVVPGLAEGEP